MFKKEGPFPMNLNARKTYLGVMFVALVILLLAPAAAGAVRPLDAPPTPEQWPPAPHLVQDINTSTASSYPTELTPAGENLFFVADDGIHGIDLWITDGTASGTGIVKDLQATAPWFRPRELSAMGELVYFSGADGAHGEELWVSDGTDAGTHLVRDINPGMSSSYPKGTDRGWRDTFLFCQRRCARV